MCYIQKLSQVDVSFVCVRRHFMACTGMCVCVLFIIHIRVLYSIVISITVIVNRLYNYRVVNLLIFKNTRQLITQSG